MKKPKFLIIIFSVLLGLAVAGIVVIFIQAKSVGLAVDEDLFALLAYGFMIVFFSLGIFISYQGYKKALK